MSIFRRPRAFISYSHEDELLLKDLVAFLEERSVEPIFDADIHVGDRLTRAIRRMIEKSDGVIMLGSQTSLTSVWCEREVRHARGKGIPVYPVLVDDIRDEDVMEWFKGGLDLSDSNIKYARNPRDQGWNALIPVIKRLRQGRPIELRCIVAIILFLLLGAPIPMMVLFGLVIGQAADSVRSQQQQIERMNADIETSATRSDGPMVPRRSSATRCEWIRRGTNTVEAWDAIEGAVVRQRHFLDSEGEIAVDTIITVRAPDGSVSLRKTRHIQPHGMSDTVIEDEFDGSGTLISKRIRPGQDARWYSYRDVARSIYPAVVPTLPIISYR